MEWWASTNGNTISDAGGDLVEKFLLDLGKLYTAEFGRVPTRGDLADTLKFGIGSALTITCDEENRPFTVCETVADMHKRVTGTPGPINRPIKGAPLAGPFPPESA